MGTGASVPRTSETDEDADGDELDDDFTHKIPDESRPRRGQSFASAALRTVGSLGLKKGDSTRNKRLFQTTSLRSNYEEAETERLKKKLERTRDLHREKESEFTKIREELEGENRRFRGELRMLHTTCNELRDERDEANQAKELILQRARLFEEERDTVKRQFKLFREAKEREIQDLLLAKRKVEADLQQIANKGSPDPVGNALALDLWITSIESEPSVDQFSPTPPNRGSEYSHGFTEKDGPFTNISRDDWNAVVPSVRQLVSTNLQLPFVENKIIIYVSAPSGMEEELQIMKQVYLPKLEYLCERFDQFIVMVHFPEHPKTSEREDLLADQQTRLDQVTQATVFVAFLGTSCDRFTAEEYQHTGPDKAIFCFRSPNRSGSSSMDNSEITTTGNLKMQVRQTASDKLLDGYSSPEEAAGWVHKQLHTHLAEHLGLTKDEHMVENPRGPGWAMDWYELEDADQAEALRQLAGSPHEIGMGKYFSDLNEHVSFAGPRPPMVVYGEEGCGKSLLLSKWITLEQSSMSGRLVLYHFVGSMPSCRSRMPGRMLQRLTVQLMRQLVSPNISFDNVNVTKEFPRLLEKVASKLQCGIAIVIDSADKLQESASHTQWLLDPLPINVRVILSVTGKTRPKAWRSWPSLEISPLDIQASRELFMYSWKTTSDGHDGVSQEEVVRLFSNCSLGAVSNPRFVTMLGAVVGSCTSSDATKRCCATCFSQKSVMDLVHHLLERIEAEFLPKTAGTLLRQVMLCLAVSRRGMNESELFHLLSFDWSTWLPLVNALYQRRVLTRRMGLVMFSSDQIREAVKIYYSIDNSSTTVERMRGKFVEFLEGKQRSCHVTRRLVDELPWQLLTSGLKEELRKCLLNTAVFQTLFENGCLSELLSYWRYLEVDQASLGPIYADVIKKLEREDKSPVEVAEVYELVGRFLKSAGAATQAPSFLHKALETREAALDPDHPLVAQALHHLAEMYAQSGNFSASEAYYKQAIEIKETALGPEHPSLEADLEGLAVLYKKNNKHSAAEDLHRRFVAIRQNSSHAAGQENLRRVTLHVEELAQGPPSAEVARSLNELGVLNFLQKNHELAESFFRRSLEMRQSVLGLEHRDVAQSLHNLAGLKNDQKIYSEAEELYSQALDIRSKLFSDDHACVVSTVRHLALVYKKQGKYAEAEPLYRRVLDVREKLHGPSHPSVATELNNLAVILCLQKKHAMALPLYERARKIYEETLGPSHPRVVETLINLAKLHFDQEKLECAAGLYKQASELRDSYNANRALSRRSSFGVQSAQHLPTRWPANSGAHSHDNVSGVMSL